MATRASDVASQQPRPGKSQGAQFESISTELMHIDRAARVLLVMRRRGLAKRMPGAVARLLPASSSADCSRLGGAACRRVKPPGTLQQAFPFLSLSLLPHNTSAARSAADVVLQCAIECPVEPLTVQTVRRPNHDQPGDPMFATPGLPASSIHRRPTGCGTKE